MNAADIRFPLPGVSYVSETERDAYLRGGAWLPITAGHALRGTARRLPAKVALIAPERRVTFGEWNDAADRLGAGLLDLGLVPGDRVLFQMGTIIETAIALFGCFKAGIIPVCTLPQHREIEIGDLARRTQAKAHFVQADFSGFDLVSFAQLMADRHPPTRRIITARGGRHAGTVALEDLIDAVPLRDAQRRLAAVDLGIQDVLTFQLSGGTTAFPKVVPRFHGEYLGASWAWGDRVRLSERDVSLWSLPLIHNAGQILMLIPTVLYGATLVLMPRLVMDDFFRCIERERVSIVTSIGPIASHVLDYPDVAQHDLSSLRLFMTLNRSDALEAHLKVPCTNMFGITEGLLTVSEPDAPTEARFQTVGRPANPMDEVRLLAIGSEEEAPVGEVGELAFRGPSMTRGYYGMPEENRRAFTSDGFFRSGDLMKARTISGRTYYSFEGRVKDNIDRGGEKFGAEEIERLIGRHPDVADSSVVAMPDRVYGEKACAYLIMRPGRPLPTVLALGQFLLEQGLAKFKLPERIEPIDTFPLTRAGKVDKPALRAMVAAHIRHAQHP